MKPRYSWDYICIAVEDNTVIGGLYTQRGVLIKDAIRCRMRKPADIKPGDVFEATGASLGNRGEMRNSWLLRLRPDKETKDCLTPIAVEKLSNPS